MKTLLLLNLFFAVNSYSQNNKSIQLLNIKDSTAIVSANIFIDNKYVTSSNSQGNFSIDIDQYFTTLKISHTTFGTNFYKKNKVTIVDIIYITEKSNNLEEVVIKSKKKIRKTILPEKNIINFKRNGINFPFGWEIAIYVPNYNSLDKYYINKIIINTEKNQFTKSKNSKYIPFEVNLFNVDTIDGIPDKKIFEENFFCVRSQNENNVTIDLSSKTKIQFPKNGIFIVVNLFDEKYYNERGYFEKPSFKVVKRSSSSNFKEYHRMLVNGEKSIWREPIYSKINLQCFYFGLEIIN